jgi:hypothetical protein
MPDFAAGHTARGNHEQLEVGGGAQGGWDTGGQSKQGQTYKSIVRVVA